ncbi:biosynthetic peptidoglycan transglycosylase [Anaerosporobacter faecicola]|uniref:biosynthetic peptidoglycan transglycosylase n=1 Tax=Anaerosporobacter faecicola TaxID=2718714 RepID=UPI001439E734|nr:biosynthetic peptidoglycan transglycosylase [Anaerosporobacter faecicola]
MKKRRIIGFGILSFLCICFLASIIYVTPVVRDGYHMYQKAMEEESIEDKVQEIRQKATFIPLDQIPEEYLTALVKSEDQRYYSHHGFDYIATARAMVNNIKARAFKEGGSTITQQLAKNMYFSFEKKLERKVAELFVAKDLERKLSKEEILELYCNVIYFGEDCYGIKEAANHYYGIEPAELSEDQIKALVYTIKSPNNYNPNAGQIYTIHN